MPCTLRDVINIPHGFFFLLVITFVYAVLVIILCLLVDRILSLNPITRMIFGEKVRSVSGEVARILGDK